MNTPHDSLTRTLGQKAEQFAARGGAELDLAQVLDRAGEIRRGRRMRASMLMAACVLAIVAPVGIIALDHDKAGQEPTPARRVEDRSPIGLTGLRHGDQPHIGYAEGGRFHVRDSAFVVGSAGRVVTAVAPVTGGLLVATRDDTGDLRAKFIDEQGGRTVDSGPMEGGFAVSAGGQLGAFVRPDGTPVVVADRMPYTLPRIPRGTGFDAIAVRGTACSAETEQQACAVWVSTSGASPQTWVTATKESASLVAPRLHPVVDVSEDDRVAGYTSVSDTGSCSAVVALPATRVAWSTCDHRLLSFSPEGTRLLAGAAYADGLGDTQVAVLDAATGKVGLDLKVADGGAITQMVWEDDTHLLATVYEGNRWGVVRIGLDGRRELAVAPVRDSGDLESPFVLATR